jgi:hypothetical protein
VHLHPALTTTARPTTSEVSDIQLRIALPRRTQAYTRYREFENVSLFTEFGGIANPSDPAAHRIPSRPFPLTRASSNRHSQDGYLSGLSAQARRHRCQASASFPLSYFRLNDVLEVANMILLQFLPYVIASSSSRFYTIQKPLSNRGTRRSAWEVFAVVCSLSQDGGQGTAGTDPSRSEPVKRTWKWKNF